MTCLINNPAYKVSVNQHAPPLFSEAARPCWPPAIGLRSSSAIDTYGSDRGDKLLGLLWLEGAIGDCTDLTHFPGIELADSLADGRSVRCRRMRQKVWLAGRDRSLFATALAIALLFHRCHSVRIIDGSLGLVADDDMRAFSRVHGKLIEVLIRDASHPPKHGGPAREVLLAIDHYIISRQFKADFLAAHLTVIIDYTGQTNEVLVANHGTPSFPLLSLWIRSANHRSNPLPERIDIKPERLRAIARYGLSGARQGLYISVEPDQIPLF